MNQNTKQVLYKQLQTRITQKITTATTAIQAAIESRDNETKSSVGDKYETGRAMMQQEQHRNEVRLDQALTLKKELSQLDMDKSYDRVELGSLVQTNRGIFFLSIGLGKMIMEQVPYYAISIVSPIGKAIVGKQKGDKVEFQGKMIVIEEVG